MNLPDMLTFNEADALPGGAGAVHGSGQRLIVNNPKLKRQQRIHAIGIAFMGSAGLTAALVLHCCVQPVSAVAVALFFLFFFLSLAVPLPAPLPSLPSSIRYHLYVTHW